MRWLWVALLGSATGVDAETITFEANEGVRFIRCTDVYGDAVCETIFPAEEASRRHLCVALDAGGEPLASDVGVLDSLLIYRDLDAQAVADVVCRPV